ncbi:hypothetical protein [Rhodovulum sp. 12E13]|nr:hypothetical protein [Rhodovulum sp. 12E13]
MPSPTTDQPAPAPRRPSTRQEADRRESHLKTSEAEPAPKPAINDWASL